MNSTAMICALVDSKPCWALYIVWAQARPCACVRVWMYVRRNLCVCVCVCVCLCVCVMLEATYEGLLC